MNDANRMRQRKDKSALNLESQDREMRKDISMPDYHHDYKLMFPAVFLQSVIK